MPDCSRCSCSHHGRYAHCCTSCGCSCSPDCCQPRRPEDDPAIRDEVNRMIANGDFG